MNRKPLFARVVLATFILSAIGGSAQAATSAKSPVVKPIPVIALTPQLDTHLSPNDDISAALISPQNAFLIGTLESSTATIVTSPSLGGESDGFISALDWNSLPVWSQRLGGAGDDIATAATFDTLGNIWIVGASNIPTPTPTPAPTSSPTPSNLFNPGHISVTPAPAITTGLRRLLLWEISSISGSIKATFGYDFTNAIDPQAISYKLGKLTVQGLSNDPAGSHFQILLTTSGAFSHPTFQNVRATLASPVTFIKSQSYLWQSYVTNRPISGISGFKPKVATTVLIRSSLKSGKIVDLYTLPGSTTSVQYQKGQGILLVMQVGSDFEVSEIKTP